MYNDLVLQEVSLNVVELLAADGFFCPTCHRTTGQTQRN